MDSLQAIIKIFQNFTLNTGLKVNFEKSVIFRIGAIKNGTCKMNVSENFKWSNKEINSLGIKVMTDDMTRNNYMTVIQKAENVLKVWKMYDSQFSHGRFYLERSQTKTQNVSSTG